MSGADRKTRLHLAMGHVVTIATLVVIAAGFDLVPRAIAMVAALGAMIALIFMFATRRSDEWVASLWSAGASAGFLGAIGWLLFAPFIEGVIDGIRGDEAAQDLPAAAASIVALACFALAFNLKRLRGY